MKFLFKKYIKTTVFLTFNKLSYFKGKNQVKTVKFSKNAPILHFNQKIRKKLPLFPL